MTNQNNAPISFTIICFGRGHTIVCESQYVDMAKSMLRVPKACTIRAWGTQMGLGELSAKGHQQGTVLDAIAFPIAIPADAVHIIYECSEAASKSFLKHTKEAEAKLLKGE